MSDPTPREVLDALKRHYNGSELEELAMFVDIPYGNLEGNSTSAKALAMVKYSQRHGKYEDLIQEMAANPAVKWHVPSDKKEDEKPAPPAGTTIIVQGDLFAGDRIGDDISIGDIVNSDGIAVGKGSSSEVTEITIERAPKNKSEFVKQLQVIQLLINKAISNGDLSQENGDTANRYVKDLLDEINQEKPRGSFISFSMSELINILATANDQGSGISTATPIINELSEAANSIF